MNKDEDPSQILQKVNILMMKKTIANDVITGLRPTQSENAVSKKKCPRICASLLSEAPAENLTVGEMIEARKQKIEGTEKPSLHLFSLSLRESWKGEAERKRAATKKKS